MNKCNQYNLTILTSICLLAVLSVPSRLLASSLSSNSQTGVSAVAFILAIAALPIGYLLARSISKEESAVALPLLVVIFILLTFICRMYGWATTPVLVFAAGFLLGYIFGFRSKSKRDATLPDYQYGRPAISSARHSNKSSEFLKGHSDDTRKLVQKLRVLEAVLLLSAVSLPIWVVASDSLRNIISAIFVRRGDGTLYFITLDPIFIGVPLILLSLIIIGTFTDKYLPRLAGDRADVWAEFIRLRSSSSPEKQKISNALAMYFILPASVIALLMYTDCFIKVTDRGVAINDFMSIGSKFYGWNDVKSAVTYQETYYCKNSSIPRTRFAARVVFADGYEWKPDMSCARRSSDIEKAALYIKARSKK